MRRQGYGRIINISSVHGLVASIEKAAYVSAKHAIVGLTKVIRPDSSPLFHHNLLRQNEGK
jgi:NAD(P)-dependent dehydrogenase (short-subunit alcohol dehydrogenase family)